MIKKVLRFSQPVRQVWVIEKLKWVNFFVVGTVIKSIDNTAYKFIRWIHN